MKRYLVALALIAGLMYVPPVLYAADNQEGTWKLNLAKSKYNPASLAPKSTTAKLEAAPDGIKATVDTVNSENQKIHYEFTAKYDGKDYPISGDPTRDTISYKRIDDYTFESVSKKAGKATVTTRNVYAKDGKSRTLTTTEPTIRVKRSTTRPFGISNRAVLVAEIQVSATRKRVVQFLGRSAPVAKKTKERKAAPGDFPRRLVVTKKFG
jgi:hypothetical protein